MGTVNIVFSSIGGASGLTEVYSAVPLAAQNVTSSGTSAQSAAAPSNCAVRIRPDADIYVKAGSNPTAAVGGDWGVSAGAVLDLLINRGDKIAVIEG